MTNEEIEIVFLSLRSALDADVHWLMDNRPLLVFRPKHKLRPLVLAGLDPAIHGPRQAPCQLPWIPGTRPGMDDEGLLQVHYLIASKH